MARELRFHTDSRPKYIESGGVAFVTHGALVAKRDEIAVTLALITHRRLFGEVYSGFIPEYFDVMPRDSGLFVCPFLRTSELISKCDQPGDTDLIVIPYEGHDLILHRTIAIEIKVIRATYMKQNKSPNEYGFTQAKKLLELGFPYVAVAHLIVSDQSPREAWREISLFQVVDEFGRVEPLPNQEYDMMPSDLIRRAFGRLIKASSDDKIGLAASYLGSNDFFMSSTYHADGIWIPLAKPALLNDNFSDKLLNQLAVYFSQNPNKFLDNPRVDPE